MSIFWKQFISSFLIIFLILFLFAFLVIGQLKAYDKSLTKERLLTAATLVSEVLEPSIDKGNPSEIQRLVSELGQKTGVRITVIDQNGTVLGDSAASPADMDSHKDRPEVKEAIANDVGESSRYSETLEREMLYVAIPYRAYGNRIRAVIRTSLPLSFLQSSFHPVERKVIYLGGILTVAALLLSMALSKTLSSSLRGIINTSEELAKGNLDISIPAASGKSEISKISTALSRMAQNLNELFKQLSKEKNQLEAVLSAMSEGVMVVSHEGRVIIINSALKKMFSLKDDPTRKQYWEILRNRELTKLVESVLEKWMPDSREIFYLYPDEKHYFVNVIPLDSPDREVIVVMFDITDFKRLEKIKADFIANVSHELRTPLTAIKGYTETLEEEAYESPEDQKHFVRIIKRHTDRLINLVSDLLVLSEVESRDSLSKENPASDFEEINMNELIKSSLDALRSKAQEKGIDVSFRADTDVCRLKANRFLLEQMFINLIDNAVKYTPENGKVEIRASRENSHILTEISDNGIGIPKEHIPRIFERFYRVDKTRSRNLGGTGLGLSIVKHIVIMHGGRIEVHSEEGKGSKFSITLPA
ncbi:MAG TPA: ATP-binding protein [Thermodesulfobacteriota bacterium]|nr:ATP-binding protein [Thermodesulfobacteriota bacterium]